MTSSADRVELAEYREANRADIANIYQLPMAETSSPDINILLQVSRNSTIPPSGKGARASHGSISGSFYSSSTSTDVKGTCNQL